MLKKGIAYDSGVIKLLLLASMVIVLAVGLTGTIGYLITKNEAVNKLKTKDLIFMADSISSKIAGRMERAIESSLHIAQDPEIIQWIAEGEKDPSLKDNSLTKLGRLVQTFGYNNSFIASSVTYHYWTESGEIIDTLSKDDPNDVWFFRTLASGKRVSVVIDYNKERNDTFVFINALMGDLHQPIAVAGVGLSLKDLSEDFETIKYGNHSNLWVIDDQGSIWLSDDYTHRGRNINELIPEEIKEWAIRSIRSEDKTSTVMDYQSSEGKLMDIISYPIPSTNLKILFQIEREETIAFLDSIKWNTITAAFISLIFIVIIFYFISHYLVNPFKRTLILNEELEQRISERTKELMEKNGLLMDSIDYARRIQESVLPDGDKLNEIFTEHFLLWKPRDTVGGDFYWIKKFDDNDYLIAVGDCTGHGVPGALMTMVSVSILNQITDDQNKSHPSLILNKLNQLIREILNKDNGNVLVDDGLDIGLCYVKGKEQLTFAGAKCSLYMKNEKQLEEIKGDRKGIGYRRTKIDYAFTDVFIQIGPDDIFYLTTDGYIDQNGGPKDHSFGKQRFKEIIESSYSMPFSAQEEEFFQQLQTYMGEEKQRDDITVLAFKP